MQLSSALYGERRQTKRTFQCLHSNALQLHNARILNVLDDNKLLPHHAELGGFRYFAVGYSRRVYRTAVRKATPAVTVARTTEYVAYVGTKHHTRE